MNSLLSRSFSASAGMLAAAATLAIAASAPEAHADSLCGGWTGRLCGRTESCQGQIVSQCETVYYYYNYGPVIE